MPVREGIKKMKKRCKGIWRRGVCLFMVLTLASCGGERPFEARYTSPNTVLVTYDGVEYELDRYQRKEGLPFQYMFESDGDLNLTIDGEEYEIDSPFDVDKKKTVKKNVKKQSTKKTTSTKKKKSNTKK